MKQSHYITLLICLAEKQLFHQAKPRSPSTRKRRMGSERSAWADPSCSFLWLWRHCLGSSIKMSEMPCDGHYLWYFIWLVVWECIFLHFPIHIGNVIIPIDELIFFRGVAQPPTRYVFLLSIITGWRLGPLFQFAIHWEFHHPNWWSQIFFRVARNHEKCVETFFLFVHVMKIDMKINPSKCWRSVCWSFDNSMSRCASQFLRSFHPFRHFSWRAASHCCSCSSSWRSGLPLPGWWFGCHFLFSHILGC